MNPPEVPQPVSRDDGTLDPTHFATLPGNVPRANNGPAVLLDAVTQRDGTVIQHRV